MELKDQKVKEEFMRLRALGMSYSKISTQISVSKTTLIRWNRDFEPEIERLKGVELEAMLEEFMVGRKDRVKRYAAQLARVENELDRRKLSEVETHRLIGIFVKLLEALRRDIEPSRVELSGGVQVADPLARWEEIIRTCGVIEDSTQHIAAGQRRAISVLPECPTCGTVLRGDGYCPVCCGPDRVDRKLTKT